MEWTREKTLTLIEEYRKRPGLWDMTHEDYRKKDIKKELLDQVAKEFDRVFPQVEIEKKFHTLRTQYHREINRMNQSRENNEPYKSKWFAFKHLEFLSSPNACRSGRSTTVKVKIEKAESDTSAITTGEEDDDANDSPPTKYLIKSVPVTTYTTTLPAHIQTEFITASPKNHHKNSNNNSSGQTTKIEIQTPVPQKLQRAASNKSRIKDIRCITRKELESIIEDATKNMDEQSETEIEHTAVTQTTGTGETTGHQHMIIKEITVPMNTSSPAGYNNQITLTEHHRVIQTGVNTYETEQQTEEIIDDSTHQNLTDSSNIHDETANSYNHQSTVNHHNSMKLASQRQQHHQQQKQQQRSDQQQQIYEEIQYEDQIQHQQQLPTLTGPGSSQNPIKKFYYEKVPIRDEFSIFGEYVANELRFITNKDILVRAKHKINVALFEACTNQLNRLE